MNMTRNNAKRLLGQLFMPAFAGTTPSTLAQQWLTERGAAGVTLFRAKNVVNPAQVRELVEALQRLAATAGHPPLLVAVDQEGGQLEALAGLTPFPGNMALGATRDASLAWRVGHALGRELAAVGVNVDYAPVCDVNVEPANPNVGVRAFGDDPQLVAELATALSGGLQEAGVAATAKHFPGNGASALDPHEGVPVLPFAPERLEAVEFLPFRAAIDAGVRLMMTAHVALPALTGRHDLPATLSREIMHGLLREEMGFGGVVISDALDMHAITQGAGQVLDALAAVLAGVDLLLLAGEEEAQNRLYRGLCQALSRGLLPTARVQEAAVRVGALQRWTAGQEQPSLEVVGCAEHRQLAREVAARSLTLVRDEAGLLPLRPDPDTRVAVVMPTPRDLTPADTSSYVTPGLASALRPYFPAAEEFITGHPPTVAEVGALREQLAEYDLLLLLTLSASMDPAQADLVVALQGLGKPTVTIAGRTPYDLLAYPQTTTHICTYSIQPPSMQALAAALVGEADFPGRLPVQLSG